VRSKWPTIALPSAALLVQLPQVVSPSPGASVPSSAEPVRMSCMFGVSPRPFTVPPFSVRAVCLFTLLLSPWRSATLLAIS